MTTARADVLKGWLARGRMVFDGTQFTPQRLDALAELMNIAFGRVASSLSELVDAFVTLQVPAVEWVPTSEMLGRLEELVGAERVTHIVCQPFRSRFSGEAVLIIDGGASEVRSIADRFGMEGDLDPREVALEIGNIVLGACVGKLAELLGAHTSYSPPHIAVLGGTIRDVPVGSESQDLSHALLMRTGFEIRASEFDGFVLLLLPPSGIVWLLEAVDRLIRDSARGARGV